jgi:uncharacterized Zn finger protein
MATQVPLTEAMIEAIASPESLTRGREYREQGRVLQLIRRGDELYAEVLGSEAAPYQVRVRLGPHGFERTECSCAYGWGGACKHIVAALLLSLHEPERVEERPPLAAVLAALDTEELRELVLSLARHWSGLVDWIEAQAESLRTASHPAIPLESSHRRHCDPEPVIQESRRRAEELLEAGRYSAYPDAAWWLERARDAYHAAGRDAEWQAYLEELLTRHRRKHTLVPRLRALR